MNQYREINPELAVNLGQDKGTLSEEQEQQMEKLVRRKALNNLAVSFINSMVSARDDFTSKYVVEKAYELANQVLSTSEKMNDNEE